MTIKERFIIDYLHILQFVNESIQSAPFNSRELGEFINVSESKMSRFLNGKSESSSLDYIINLCDSVGITVNLTAYVGVENEL